MRQIMRIGLIVSTILVTIGAASADTIRLDIDADGATDEVSRLMVEGQPVLQFAKASGGVLQVTGIAFNDLTEIRILPPTDLDGNGSLDLVIGGPLVGTGRVWFFAGGAQSTGSLSVSSATLTLYSTMPGAMRFGGTLGLLPGSQFGAPSCLRVQSWVETRDGAIHPRVEVYRLDTQKMILVVEGQGALTDVWIDRGDADRDGKVDASDIISSISRVGTQASYDGDFDGDGIITTNDVVTVMVEATTRSAATQEHWQSVVQAMLARSGGVDAWGLPIYFVAPPDQQPPAAPASSGTGVFYCARPLDGWYENLPWWLAPFCHAYLQIGDWTHGIGGSSENTNDARSRKCWEATRATTGTVTLNGQTINCADATIQQIQQCVQNLGNNGGCDPNYTLVCNNCGDWVIDILHACCLNGSYLPWLIY